MEDKKSYAVIVMLTSLPAWLRLSRAERGTFNAKTVTPIFARYADRVSVEWYDAEAFNARCSDVALFRTNDLQQYYFLMEELRDTALFSEPYFELNEVIVALQDGYQSFEER